MSDKQIILVEQHLVEAAKQVTAEVMLTPVSLLESVRENDPTARAMELMELHHFDQLPVVRDERIIGLFRRSTETPSGETIATSGFESLDKCNIDCSSQVAEVVDRLIRQPSVLVLNAQREVLGLLHHADLNRQPMRVFLYLHLSALEMGFAELIRRDRSQARNAQVSGVGPGTPAHLVPLWLKYLSEHKQVTVLGRFALDRHRNVETDYIEGLELSDLFAIFRSDADLRRLIGYSSEKDFNSEAAPLVELRNSAMHPVRKVIKQPGDVSKLAGSLERANSLIGRLRQALAT